MQSCSSEPRNTRDRKTESHSNKSSSQSAQTSVRNKNNSVKDCDLGELFYLMINISNLLISLGEFFIYLLINVSF